MRLPRMSRKAPDSRTAPTRVPSGTPLQPDPAGTVPDHQKSRVTSSATARIPPGFRGAATDACRSDGTGSACGAAVSDAADGSASGRVERASTERQTSGKRTQPARRIIRGQRPVYENVATKDDRLSSDTCFQRGPSAAPVHSWERVTAISALSVLASGSNHLSAPQFGEWGTLVTTSSEASPARTVTWSVE